MRKERQGAGKKINLEEAIHKMIPEGARRKRTRRSGAGDVVDPEPGKIRQDHNPTHEKKGAIVSLPSMTSHMTHRKPRHNAKEDQKVRVKEKGQRQNQSGHAPAFVFKNLVIKPHGGESSHDGANVVATLSCIDQKWNRQKQDSR